MDIEPVSSEIVDQLTVRIYKDRQTMGVAAAQVVSAKMKELLESKENVRVVFASAPSQNEFLAVLGTVEGIDWSRVTAFHMDEWIGLNEQAPQRFGAFIQKHLFNAVCPGEVHLIDCTNSVDIESARYAALLREQDIDIICLGIGENGHIAFNDPPVADFSDPLFMKSVELDEICRNQQLHDGPFPSLEDVPKFGLTMTIPALMSGKNLFCIVPGPRKAKAVYNTLRGPIIENCPASILRSHPNAVLFLDEDAYQSS